MAMERENRNLKGGGGEELRLQQIFGALHCGKYVKPPFTIV